MLEDRLDPRLNGEEPDPIGLAARWKMNRREKEAARYDEVAAQIEAGLVKVSGAKTEDVLDRLSRKAEGMRDGSLPLSKRRRKLPEDGP